MPVIPVFPFEQNRPAQPGEVLDLQVQVRLGSLESA